MDFRSLCVPARHASASLFVMALSLQPGLWTGAHATPQPQAALPATAQVRQALQGLAMPFEANAGQFDERVAFAGRTFAGPVYVTHEGQIVYSLPGAEAENASKGGWSLTETLVSAQALEPRGGEQAITRVSRFTGPASYQAATYRSVLLGQAWPGIEVELAARGNNVEKLFHVAPQADAQRIQLRLAGAQGLRLGDAGELIAATGHGDVAYTAPVAFQHVGGQRIDVPVKYVLNARGDGYGFDVGAYDRTRPLVIDPLLQSTYLGGGDYDVPLALAVEEGTGDVLVAGYTYSGDFPGTDGGAQSAWSDGRDAFIARLSGNLKALRQSSYLGGSGSDTAQALAIDVATGDVLVVGGTGSDNFPGTSGGAQPALAGINNGFVTRLSGDLATLRQSTYLGGGNVDFALALAIDAVTGDVLIAGDTSSGDFPGTAGSAQPALAGYQDGFVARMSGDLGVLRQSSYLGGHGDEVARALAIDATTGDVLVTGYTDSDNFPGAAGGAQLALGGGMDGFVARLSGNLKALYQSSYLGGSGSEYSTAMAIDATTGDVLVAGYTYSGDFPGMAGGAQSVLGGGADGFVARLSGNLNALRQSSYLGGSGSDYSTALAIDAATGDVLVAGYTYSNNFPGTAGGAQPTLDAGGDGFVTRLSGDLKALRQSSYLGGSGADTINAQAIDAATGDVLVAGSTYSGDFPGTAGGAQVALSGGADSFIARLSGDLKAISPQKITFPSQGPQDFVAGASFAIDPAATAKSGLPVSYASTTPAVCTVAGSTVTMVSAGTCTVVASQGGNTQWEPAADVAVDIVLSDNAGPVDPPEPPEPPVPGKPTPVPALGPLGLMLTSLLAGGMGWLRLRRRGL